jgi:hypothetical protein
MPGLHVPGSKPGEDGGGILAAPTVRRPSGPASGILPPAAAVLSANRSRQLGIAFNQDRPTASDALAAGLTMVSANPDPPHSPLPNPPQEIPGLG